MSTYRSAEIRALPTQDGRCPAHLQADLPVTVACHRRPPGRLLVRCRALSTRPSAAPAGRCRHAWPQEPVAATPAGVGERLPQHNRPAHRHTRATSRSRGASGPSRAGNGHGQDRGARAGMRAAGAGPGGGESPSVQSVRGGGCTRVTRKRGRTPLLHGGGRQHSSCV